MSEHCSNPNCYAHEGEACALGFSDFRKCQNWRTKKTEDSISAKEEEISSIKARVPWSGSVLGLADLSALLPRARSIVVGVLGSFDAGKTTILTGSYLQILRGQPLAGAGFAGSRTLGAWESLASFTRFDDPLDSPTFPPHTPRGTSRVPGLLHFSLREPQGNLHDVLLTDAPGEWFSSWAVNENSPESAGAQWVVRSSDTFLIVADCDRLSGQKRGQARSEIRQLIERLSNHVANRPTVLVWAKSDKQPKEGIKRQIVEALHKNIPHAKQIETTIEKPESLKTAIEMAIELSWLSTKPTPIIEPVLSHSPFESFRGKNDHS